MPELKSYCRLCHALCGMVATIEDGRITKVRGDRDNAATRGFACSKGLLAPEFHHGPGRLRGSVMRDSIGGLRSISSEDALAGIGDRIAGIVEEHGPQSIAVFAGTQSAYNVVHRRIIYAFLRAIGSKQLYTTMTIDQSAKWVKDRRLGRFKAGGQRFEQSDVWLLSGTNPLVSMQGNMLGMPVYDVVKRLREAKARGLKLIVIDPVETQTAKQADLFLQVLPGQDALLLAAMLKIILSEGLHDAEFCSRYVRGLDHLRASLGSVDLDQAAGRTGVPVKLIEDAARLFGSSKMGMAAGGTGVDMGPHSNLAEHLIELLNVVCGRYLRAGDEVPNPGILLPRKPVFAEVEPPRREWEDSPKTRVGGYGTLYNERMSAVLADEILTPGDDKIRVLICAGSNPAMALPDQGKAVRALRSLDLLVSIDPRMSETARLAHYVIAPTLPFERPDHTQYFEATIREPFAQYTPAIVAPEPDMDVVDDWYVYFAIARRLNVTLRLAGIDLPMNEAPCAEDLLRILARDGGVPYDDVRKHPIGQYFDVEPMKVLPPRSDASGRFDVLPDDVKEELRVALAEVPDASRTHLLGIRRLRQVMNSVGRDLPAVRSTLRYNPAYMNPDDLKRLGIDDQSRVVIRSDHGAIPAIVVADPAVRSGVVSMTHGFGGLPDEHADYEDVGSSTTRLVSSTVSVQTINGMPRLTAVPVSIEKA